MASKDTITGTQDTCLEFTGSTVRQTTHGGPELESNDDQPDMQPFFVLIEDTSTTDTIHPEVRYIFSDDEDAELTNATLNAAEDLSTTNDNDAEHRVVIVDMAADGKTVAKVSSLSRHWQIASTEVGNAPSWHGNSDTNNKSLMLKLSGAGGSSMPYPAKLASSTLPELVSRLDQELQALELHLAGYTGDTQHDNPDHHRESATTT